MADLDLCVELPDRYDRERGWISVPFDGYGLSLVPCEIGGWAIHLVFEKYGNSFQKKLESKTDAFLKVIIFQLSVPTKQKARSYISVLQGGMLCKVLALKSVVESSREFYWYSQKDSMAKL